jgi:hypothetical protein
VAPRTPSSSNYISFKFYKKKKEERINDFDIYQGGYKGWFNHQIEILICQKS